MWSYAHRLGWSHHPGYGPDNKQHLLHNEILTLWLHTTVNITQVFSSLVAYISVANFVQRYAKSEEQIDQFVAKHILFTVVFTCDTHI